jgi:hypothetical protein
LRVSLSRCIRMYSALLPFFLHRKTRRQSRSSLLELCACAVSLSCAPSWGVDVILRRQASPLLEAHLAQSHVRLTATMVATTTLVVSAGERSVEGKGGRPTLGSAV